MAPGRQGKTPVLPCHRKHYRGIILVCRDGSIGVEIATVGLGIRRAATAANRLPETAPLTCTVSPDRSNETGMRAPSRSTVAKRCRKTTVIVFPLAFVPVNHVLLLFVTQTLWVWTASETTPYR